MLPLNVKKILNLRNFSRLASLLVVTLCIVPMICMNAAVGQADITHPAGPFKMRDIFKNVIIIIILILTW
jgi:hypothetical protein